MPLPEPFRHEFIVSNDEIDKNGHVNNVVYIQWMQDVAVLHSKKCGGIKAMHAHNCSWVVRSHAIDYLSPAFAGDTILAVTWVANLSKVRSLRRYKFIRQRDGKILAKGETDWVFINAENGRPHGIPDDVRQCYPLLADYE